MFFLDRDRNQYIFDWSPDPKFVSDGTGTKTLNFFSPGPGPGPEFFLPGPGPEFFFTGTGTGTGTKIFFSPGPGPGPKITGPAHVYPGHNEWQSFVFHFFITSPY